MHRRTFSSALLASAGSLYLLGGGAASAQTTAPVEGRDYTLVRPPQAPPADAKVEVLEFFSYACPHCNAFEPMLSAWAHGLPADVAFRRVPVPFLFTAENFQRTYYALESLDLVEKMQPKVYAAVHIEKMRLDKADDIAALVARNGGDAARFLSAFKSFTVATAVSRAKKTVADYKIDGVPTLAIQGMYLTSPSIAGGAEKSLAVADALIARARKT